MESASHHNYIQQHNVCDPTVENGAFYYTHVSQADELSLCRFPDYPAHINCLNDFVDFLAQKKRFPREHALKLVQNSQSLFQDGWAGLQYRDFTEVLLELYRPLHDDITDDEVLETYKQHGNADFLRMLSYPIPNFNDQQLQLEILGRKKHIDIVDYGCGLSQRSIALATRLRMMGTSTKIYLLDIHRPWHWEFLSYLCNRYGIDFEFMEVTIDNIYPDLPEHDLCDNVSVLEHVRDPILVVENIYNNMRPGGLFMAGAVDAVEEMMHITPNLRNVRERLSNWGYQQIQDYYGASLLLKPGGNFTLNR